jgi:hypothetical protein
VSKEPDDGMTLEQALKEGVTIAFEKRKGREGVKDIPAGTMDASHKPYFQGTGDYGTERDAVKRREPWPTDTLPVKKVDDSIKKKSF